jgi:hypothetical protein
VRCDVATSRETRFVVVVVVVVVVVFASWRVFLSTGQMEGLST